MVSYLWRCPYRVYLIEEEKQMTAVGPNEGAAMVCGCLITLTRSQRTSHFIGGCFLAWVWVLFFFF